VASGVTLGRMAVPGYQRLFAWLMAHSSTAYERWMAERERRPLGALGGVVVEVGPGAGANVPYYAPGVRLIGIEPNPHMHPYLEQAARSAGMTLDLRQGKAEPLPLEAGSADAVVATLVLCSVDDPAAALREIRRVLKPGGRFVFIEHVVAAPGTLRRYLQRWARPLWRVVGDGCHPDRAGAAENAA